MFAGKTSVLNGSKVRYGFTALRNWLHDKNYSLYGNGRRTSYIQVDRHQRA